MSWNIRRSFVCGDRWSSFDKWIASAMLDSGPSWITISGPGWIISIISPGWIHIRRPSWINISGPGQLNTYKWPQLNKYICFQFIVREDSRGPCREAGKSTKNPWKIDAKSYPHLAFIFNRFLIDFCSILRPLEPQKLLKLYRFYNVFLLLGLFKIRSIFYTF